VVTTDKKTKDVSKVPILSQGIYHSVGALIQPRSTVQVQNL